VSLKLNQRRKRAGDQVILQLQQPASNGSPRWPSALLP
jgi:hypothetical protein